MKKLLVILLLIPVLGMSQTKNLLTSNRYFCKMDKIQEFEKALAQHAQTYHKGDWNWRVWTIQSGPDAGAYMVSEGPSDWSTLDGRGDINPAHRDDWTKNVAPLIARIGASSYMSFQPDMSTVDLKSYTDKIQITHITAKPGKIVAVADLEKKLKKVWEASKESVAVYSPVASGEPGYVNVTRLKEGFKELADDYRKPMAERYNAVYGPGSWDAYLKDFADAVENRWSELLIYKPELSSK